MCRPWKWLWGLPLLIVLAALALWTRAGDIERDLAARARAALNEAGQPWAAVSVSGRELTISGTAADAGAQEGARLAAMVAGARTVTDSTALPPVRSPFGWTIRREDGKVELSGDVPPGDARRRIAAAAAQAFPRAEIADKTQTARGAPERGWFDAVSVALNMATLMSQGRVAISDRSLAAAGVAADPLAYESLHAAGGRMPAGYAVDVSGIEPPVVARQQLALSADAGRVTLTGTVPSRGARDELADAAGAAFPGRGVSAELGIARGVVAPEQWLAAARHAIDLLALAGAGEAELLNGSFSFRAQAPDAEAFDRLGAMLSEPPARFSFASVEVTPPPVPAASPYAFSAVLGDSGPVILLGYVPDADAHRALLDEAADAFPGREVDDRLAIAAGAPDGFLAVAMLAVKAAAGLQRGQAGLQDGAFALYGEAADEGARDAVAGIVSLGLPAGFSSAVDVRAPAVETPVAAAPATEPAEPETTGSATPAETPAGASAPDAQTGEAAQADNCAQEVRALLAGETIEFEPGRAAIRDSSGGLLSRIAAAVKGCPKARLSIAGHTDSDGGDAQNMALSLERAKAVVAWLAGAGVAEWRMTAVGFGQTRPVASNESAAGKAANRRIEFFVLGGT